MKQLSLPKKLFTFSSNHPVFLDYIFGNNIPNNNNLLYPVTPMEKIESWL